MRLAALVGMVAWATCASPAGAAWRVQRVASEVLDAQLDVGIHGDVALLTTDLSRIAVRVWSRNAPRFGRATTIISNPDIRGTDLATGPRGEVLAAWEPDSGRGRYVVLGPEGRPSRPRTIATPGAKARAPAVAIGPDGTKAIAYFDGPFADGGWIFAAVARPGRPFGAPQPASRYERGRGLRGELPRVALKASALGRVSVMWSGAGEALRAAEAPRGGSFAVPFTVVPSSWEGNQHPRYEVATADDGTIFCGWQTSDGQFHLGSGRRHRPVTEAYPLPPTTGMLSVSAAGRGRGLAAWSVAADATSTDVFVATAERGRWGQPERIARVPTGAKAYLGDLLAAVASNGAQVVAWAGNQGTTVRTRAPSAGWRTRQQPGLVRDVGIDNRRSYVLIHRYPSVFVLSGGLGAGRRSPRETPRD